MYCPNCGSDNQPEVRFCRRCGTGLAAVSAALAGGSKDASLEKSKLADLTRAYYSARHKMMWGAGSFFLGAVLLGLLLLTGKWGFFWIFLWVFMGFFGNGVHQFNKGWNTWSEASTELKTLGYEKPPADLPPSMGADSSLLTESRPTTALPQQRDFTSPPSVTESTTRHLDNRKSQ